MRSFNKVQAMDESGSVFTTENVGSIRIEHEGRVYYVEPSVDGLTVTDGNPSAVLGANNQVASCVRVQSL